MRGGALAALALCTASTLGCANLGEEAHPETPAWVTRPSSVLSVFFRTTLTNPARVTGEDYERGKPAIDPMGLRVFVGSADHGLYAVDARSGEVLWRFETTGPVQGEPLFDAADDAVYFGSGDGALYKLRAKDGKLLFRFHANGECARRPVLDGDTLYFTTATDMLVAIDKRTGELRWHQQRTPAYGIEIGGHAGVAVGHGKVYTAFSDGSVMAYSTVDGAEAWPSVDLALESTTTEGQQPRYLDVDTTPLLTEVQGVPAVLVAQYDGGVFALEAETGKLLWRNELATGVNNLLVWSQREHRARPLRDTVGNEIEGPMHPARRIAIASSGRTGLWGIDVDTGKEAWRNPLPEGGISAPLPLAGAILVSTTRYGIYLFDPLRGHTIDGIHPGEPIAMSPAGVGLKAYVMTNGGHLLGLVVAPP